MARKISNLAQVTVYINGKEQALKDLDAMQKKAAGLKDEIDQLNKKEVRLAEESKEDPTKVVDYNETRKRREKLERERNQTMKLIRETKKLTEDIEEDLDHLSDLPISRLNVIMRSLNAVRNALDPKLDKNGDFLSFLNEKITETEDTIKNKKGGIVEFKDIMDDLANIDDTSLAKAEKRLESLLSSVDKDDVDRLKQLNKELSKVRREQQQRVSTQAMDIQTKVSEGKWKGTIEETQRAIELQKQYQKSLNTTDYKGLKAVEDTINGLNKKLESYRKKQTTSVLNDLKNHSYSEIEDAIANAKKLKEAAKPGTSAWNNYGKQIASATLYLEKWNEQSKRTKMIEMSKMDLGKMSDEDLKSAIRYWDGMVNGIGRTNIAAEQYGKTLEKLRAEQEKRSEKVVSKVLDQNDLGGNIDQMQQRLKILEDYRNVIDSTKPDAYLRVDAAIEKLKQGIKETQAGFMSFDDALAKARTISAGTFDGTLEDLDKIQKILKEGMATKLNLSDPNDIARLKDTQGLLEDIVKKHMEMDRVRLQEQASQTIADVNAGSFDKTIEDTQKAISLLEEYKKTLRTKTDAAAIKQADEAIEKLKRGLKEAQAGFISFSDALAKARTISAGGFDGTLDDLEKIQKILKEGMNTEFNLSDPADIDRLKETQKLLEDIAGKQIEMGRARLQEQASQTIADVNAGSFDNTIEDTQKAISLLEEYKKTLRTKTDAAAIKQADEAIEKLKRGLKEAQAGFMSFSDALAKARTISAGGFDGTLDDLEKIQKILKEGMNSELNISDPADVDRLKDTLNLLDDITRKQVEMGRARLQDQASQTIADVNAGNFDKTIEETQEAIRLLNEYKKTLRTKTDAAAIKQADEAIEKLNANLGKVKEGLMDIQDAMRIAGEVSNGTFDGTSEELARAKKSLEEYRKTLRQKTDKDEIEKVDKLLQDVSHSATAAAERIVNINHVLDNLDSTSMEDLQAAAKKLQEELQNAKRGTEEYAEKSENLRRINAELKRAKKEWEGQENVIKRTAKRLASYVAVYGGFNAIVGKMKEMVNLNLQLSDSLADVQKTTGLTGVELQELGRGLGAIDTRTATTELYNLAAAAGQIGLKTQEDVLGFAKAANVISVALNELGAEGSATITKIATLTGDVAKSGTEDALLRVGSAINELTANSAATAGPIADFISRVGGIASASGIAIHEMAALGAATDASAQSVEIAGTSMNKFISALVSNTENIAYAANLNVSELDELIKTGNTMQAVVRVLESMKNMGREGQSAVLKELGSEGARMNQYVAALVANLDMLKQQLTISREAFAENTSVMNEYNVKQESAIGILQRMKNSFLDTFVNSRMVEVLKDTLRFISSIPRDLEKIPPVLVAIKIALIGILSLGVPRMLDVLFTKLSGLYALLRGPFVAAMAWWNSAWNASAVSVTNAGKSINGFTGLLRVLWGVIKANPIGAAIAAITTLVVVTESLKDKTNRLAKATGELNDKHARQAEELQALRSAMDDSNASYADRAGAMEEINRLYSKFLGFEIRELEVYEKKAAALELIVAKLKEQQALEMKKGTQEFYNTEFSKNTQEEMDVIVEILSEIPEITSKRIPEAIRVMNKAIDDGAESSEELFKALDKYFNSDISSKFDLISESLKIRTGKDADKSIFDYFKDYYDEEQFEDYIEEYIKRRQGLLIAEENYNYQSEQASKEAHEKRIELQKAQANRIAELQKEGDKATEAEQVEHLREMLREQEEYLITSKKLQEEYKEKDEAFVRQNINDDGTVEKFNLEREYGILAYVESTKLDNIARWRNKFNEDAVAAQKKLNEAITRLEEERLKENNEAAIAAAQTEVAEADKKHKELIRSKMEKDKEWQEMYSRLLQYTVSDERRANGEKIESAMETIENLKFSIDKDPFGKALNLKDWKEFDLIIENLGKASPTSLVHAFKKLNEDYQKISDNLPALNNMFNFKVPMHTLDEARDQIYDWANQLRDELARRNLNTSGSFIFEGVEGEVEHVLKLLQTHFLKRKKEIQEAYLDGTLTAEEMNRRLSELDRELLNERVQLRKMLLNEDNSFHQAFYPELEGQDLLKLRDRVIGAETQVVSALRNAMEEDANTIKEDLVKFRQSWEKELAEGDPFRTLRSSFRSSLDDLLLMSSQFERDMVKNLQFTNKGDLPYDPFEIMGIDKESMEERFDFLMDVAQHSYMIDRDGLRKMFESHGEYYNWVHHLDDQQMDVMLAKLQWFYDESLVKQKAYADRLHKAQQSAYEQEGLKYDEVQKIQWEINNLKEQRNALVSQNLSPDIKEDQYDSNQDSIIAHTQLINRLEAELLEAQQKAADKTKNFRGKKEREAKEQMEASISALDAYYNEMEAKIRERGLELDLTETEIERQVMENNVNRQKDMIELRKKLLGDVSSFDPFANDGYKGVITGNVFFGNNKNEEALARQAEQIKVWGQALTDGMRNQIAKSNIEIQKEAQKLKEAIQKILLDKQYVKATINEMQSYFDQVDFIDERTQEKFNFLWGNTDQTKRTQKLADERMKILFKYSEDVYSEESDSFKKRLLQDAVFGSTVKKMDKEEYAAFLLLLQQFHDKVINAEKQYADERKRIIDQQWEEEGFENGYNSAERTIAIAESNLDTMQKANAIANEQDFFDRTQELILDRVALEQWAYEQKLDLYRKNNATQEQFQQLDLEHSQKQEQFQRQLLDNYIARYQQMAEVTTSYGNIIGDGFGRMLAGEEDAGKQLIKNLLTETIQMASQFAQRLILQSTFGAQMESIRATQNAAQLASAYATAMSEVGIEASKMAAIEAIAAGEITAQSMAQPDSILTWGGAGAARAAVIIGLVAAATAAALALVNSLFPDSKASNTNNRRLSTGMLTYAEGNYPVLGNDGKVYDAKYEGSGMKTGIYGGGAHFGIFSEKQPEMIVDGKTTQKLILNYPYIYDAITTIAKNGRLVNAMPTFASGDYPAGMQRITQVESKDMSYGFEQMEAMQQQLAESREINRRLLMAIENGIVAHLDGLEAYNQQKKNQRFLQRRGID